MHFTTTQARQALALTLLADRAHSNANVTWISPLAQDIYGPGAVIIAKWTCPKTIVSPYFRLCMPATGQTSDSRRSDGDDGDPSDSDEGENCGATVWPTITESAGVFQVSVTVPQVTSDEGYYLQMKDNVGALMRSPIFTLSPQAPSGPANLPDAPIAPLASIKPLYPDSPSTAAVSAASVPTTNAANHTAPMATIDPNVLSARAPPPAAAFAIPLSAVAAILLVASGLFLKHRRKLGEERTKDAEKIGLPSRTGSRNSYKVHASRASSEVDHALDVLSRHQLGYGSAPVPSFMPMNYAEKRARNPRPATRDARGPPTYRSDTRSSASSRFSRLHERPQEDDPATHAVLEDYMLPSPPLPSSASTPRCLLPAPRRLHVRNNAESRYLTDKPLPESLRYGGRHGGEPYNRVESSLICKYTVLQW
ncbi:hypothetical protein B0H10DRAFT_1981326 [Mycena sp. CBHHK59/15]|nr:hypothetical protein B0H10DRAFT_1981326 [Mycena sp. CBHHK59/15]